MTIFSLFCLRFFFRQVHTEDSPTTRNCFVGHFGHFGHFLGVVKLGTCSPGTSPIFHDEGSGSHTPYGGWPSIGLTLWLCHSLLSKMVIEIVDLPMKHGDFP